ncbi:MAG: Gx transporter family protein [Lachnospiraceae bacterium]|nr:Gx transporter family protein [Lachnospiraceae bacterium]
MTEKFSVKTLTLLSFYAVIALAIYGLESLIPYPFPIPGIKPGLANIISLIVLRLHGGRRAFPVLIVRILLSAFLFGSGITLIYSLAGGILCIIAMWGTNKLLDGKYIFITSVIGAICHNTAQLVLAAIITRTGYIFSYAPYLYISAVLTGLFTGLAAYYSIPRIKHILSRFDAL